MAVNSELGVQFFTRGYNERLYGVSCLGGSEKCHVAVGGAYQPGDDEVALFDLPCC